jgi:hypothetical protein
VSAHLPLWPLTGGGQGWTVDEACAEFARAGMPVDPARLRMVIRALPGFRPVGEKRAPAGSKGGRGHPLYEIGQLQRLHAALAPWLTPQQMED